MLDLDVIFDPDRPPLDALPSPAIRAKELLPDWWADWDERAAILEFDAGMHRERAEAEALKLILNNMRAAGIALPSDTCLYSK